MVDAWQGMLVLAARLRTLGCQLASVGYAVPQLPGK